MFTGRHSSGVLEHTCSTAATGPELRPEAYGGEPYFSLERAARWVAGGIPAALGTPSQRAHPAAIRWAPLSGNHLLTTTINALAEPSASDAPVNGQCWLGSFSRLVRLISWRVKEREPFQQKD